MLEDFQDKWDKSLEGKEKIITALGKNPKDKNESQKLIKDLWRK